MIAVMGLPPEQVEELCEEVEGAYPANYNSPAQTVVSYEESALKDLKAALKARKAKAVPLAVAGAFHSPLMQGASEKLAVHLEDLSFGEIKLPMYANVSGLPYENPEDVKEILPMQINSAVLWQKTIEQMISDGFDTFIETGPGKALTGMIGKINKEVATYNVFDDETLKACVSQLR
jgi:[acyl-carrier-protein] S-malonyltransferase